MADDWLAGVRNAVEGKRVVPPTPAGRVTGGDGDEPEPAGEPDRDETSGAAVWIAYTDAKGEQSFRTITIHTVSGHYHSIELIGAHCHVRQRFRQFRLDRIDEMVCVATGEVIDAERHCRELVDGGVLKVKDPDLNSVMRLLTFLARCDGEFHALEATVLEEQIGRYMRFFGGDDIAYRLACAETVRLAPDGKDVVRALKAIGRSSEATRLARFATDAAAAVIDADGWHRDEEVRWGVEIGAALRELAGRA